MVDSCRGNPVADRFIVFITFFITNRPQFAGSDSKGLWIRFVPASITGQSAFRKINQYIPGSSHRCTGYTGFVVFRSTFCQSSKALNIIHNNLFICILINAGFFLKIIRLFCTLLIYRLLIRIGLQFYAKILFFKY